MSRYVKSCLRRLQRETVEEKQRLEESKGSGVSALVLVLPMKFVILRYVHVVVETFVMM